MRVLHICLIHHCVHERGVGFLMTEKRLDIVIPPLILGGGIIAHNTKSLLKTVVLFFCNSDNKLSLNTSLSSIPLRFISLSVVAQHRRINMEIPSGLFRKNIRRVLNASIQPRLSFFAKPLRGFPYLFSCVGLVITHTLQEMGWCLLLAYHFNGPFELLLQIPFLR